MHKLQHRLLWVMRGFKRSNPDLIVCTSETLVQAYDTSKNRFIKKYKK